MQALRPSRAAWAATELARLPVEEQPTVSKPKLLRVGERDGDDAVLEAEGGEADGVVLDVEVGGADALAEIVGADQRREADGKIGLEAVRDGQKSGVAPDAGGACGDGFAGEDAARGFQIVGHFERGQAIGAGGERLVAKPLSALVALQLIRRYRNSSLRSLRGERGFELVTCSLWRMPRTARKVKCGCRPEILAACPESHVPCFQERVDTGTPVVLSGCRGVTGLVPQPLCMKFKSARKQTGITNF